MRLFGIDIESVAFLRVRVQYFICMFMFFVLFFFFSFIQERKREKKGEINIISEISGVWWVLITKLKLKTKQNRIEESKNKKVK